MKNIALAAGLSGRTISEATIGTIELVMLALYDFGEEPEADDAEQEAIVGEGEICE